MERRIFGIESEYGVTCVSPNGQRRLSPDEVARYMFRRVVAGGEVVTFFGKWFSLVSRRRVPPRICDTRV